MRIGRATIDYQRIGQVGTTGNFITKSINSGSRARLVINTDASGGTLEVEVLDASDDSVMTNYAQADFDDITTDTYSIEATWGGLPVPADSTIKLKFYLTTDVKVYSYEVTPGRPGPDETSLVSWWSLESDGTDSHGSNDLSEAGTPVYTTGKVNNGVDLELSDSEYLYLADNADLSAGDTDFSIGGWFKFESLGATAQRLISKRQATTNACYDMFYAGTGDDRFAFWLYTSGGTSMKAETSSSYGVVVDTWYFVVGWHDSTANTVNLQVDNGTVYSTGTSGNVPHDSTATFMIGNLAQVARYLDGMADECFFYRKVLSASERTWLYNSGSGRGLDDLQT
jgi:hypothetical protein